MKKRISKVLYFVSFNLLFFALYLNFVHRDNNQQTTVSANRGEELKGTVIVKNPEVYLNKKKERPQMASLQNTL